VKIRLLTYNIHKCIGGLDRRFNPYRIGEVISHHAPDVVLLQEVDAEAKRSGFHRLVDLLGDMLRIRHRAWFPNVRLRDGGSYGNAVLSRFAMTETRNIDLTIPPRKRRSVLHVRCRMRLESGRSRTLHFYNMHLGLSGAERKKQLERFLASHPFAKLDSRAPIVVAGDMNDVWGTLGAALLIPAGFRAAPSVFRTFPAYAPLRALDAVYIRGNVSCRGVFASTHPSARYASDHLPLIADLELEESVTSAGAR
jgi:endonuclease/exonuclease/phosphatase family metal-dependent hydrolase